MHTPTWDSGQLFALSVALSNVDNPPELIRFMEEKITPLLQEQVAYQFLSVSGSGHRLQLLADSTRVHPGEEPAAEGIPVPAALAALLREPEPRIVAADRFPFAPETRAGQPRTAGSVLTVPLRQRGEATGVLNVFAGRPDFFQPRHLSLFAQLGGLMAATVAHLVAGQALARHNCEKSQMLKMAQAVSRLRSRDDLPGFLPLLQNFFPGAEILLAALTKGDSHYTLLIKQAPGFPAQAAPAGPRDCGYCGSSVQELLKHPGPAVFRFAEIRQRFPEDSFDWVARPDEVAEVLAIPLHWAGKVTGALVVNAYREGYFQPDPLPLYGGLAEMMAVLINNILVNEELTRREREEALKLEIGNLLTSHKNREQLGQACALAIAQVVPSSFFAVRIYENPGKLGYLRMYAKSAEGPFELVENDALIRSAGLDPGVIAGDTGQLAARPGLLTGEAFAAGQASNHFIRYAHAAAGVRSLLVLAVESRRGYTTLILLGNPQPCGLLPEHLALLQTLSPQIQLSLDNLFAFEDLARQEYEKEVHLAITNIFTTNRPVRSGIHSSIGELVTGQVNRLIPLEVSFAYVTHPTHPEKDFVAGHYRSGNEFAPLSPEVFLQQFGAKPGQLSEMAKDWHGLFGQSSLYVGEAFDALLKQSTFMQLVSRHLGIRSLMGISLGIPDRTVSMLFVGSKHPYAYQESDAAILRRLAPQINLGMQNMFAFEEIQSLQKHLEQEKTYLTEEIKNTHDFEQMIGTSPLLKQAFVQVQQVAPADATVLVLGETGTGKELIARAVHHQSPRRNRVLVKVNCASLPAQLIESELFGHEKGSFTGAYDRRIGKFELANGGTIFLDEIGELPLELQAKLLRVLQEKEIERIGGKTTIPLDVRIIAATNRNLESEVAEGRFRSDLYYRLDVFPITLPPLRDRPEDIPLLANHFAQKFCKKMGKPFMGIRETAMMELMAYDWPGNIRELENIVEQAVIISQGSSLHWARPLTPTRAVPKTLSPRTDGLGGRSAALPSRAPVMPAEEDIITILRQTKGRIIGKGGAAEILRMRPSQLEEIERNYLILVLQDTNGRIRGAGGAAEKLDIKPTTLEARIRKLGITKKEIY